MESISSKTNNNDNDFLLEADQVLKSMRKNFFKVSVLSNDKKYFILNHPKFRHDRKY